MDVDNNGRTNVGDKIKYSFVVKNTGDLPLTQVVVTDSKIATVTCQATSLAVGASTTCSGEYVITANDLAAGAVENIATVTAKDPNNNDVTDKSDAGTTPDGNNIPNPGTTETPNPLGENENNTTDPTSDPTTVTLDVTGVLAGVIYLDKNGNGKQEPGEPGIEGVKVNVTDVNGKVYTLITDEIGHYNAILPNGKAILNIDITTLPNNLIQTEGSRTTEVVIPIDGLATDVDGYKPKLQVSKIKGVVYIDTNGNGMKDFNERGIYGVKIEITKSNGEKEYITTDKYGKYEALVPVGKTILKIDETTLPKDFIQTEGKIISIFNVSSKKTAVDVDGFKPTFDSGKVKGIVYIDLNGNGKKDTNELGIEGVEIEIKDSKNNIYKVKTDSYGKYEQVVAAGNTELKIVESTLPKNVVQTEGMIISNLNVPSGGEAQDIDGFKPPKNYGKVEGVVYLDKNGNGKQDSNEKGIGGVKITVVDSSGRKHEIITDEEGKYEAIVPPGKAYVGMDEGEMNDKLVRTQGMPQNVVNVPAGGVGRDIDGFRPLNNAIEGKVYFDENYNGIKDKKEENVVGVEVALYDNEDNLISKTKTDTKGYYRFENVEINTPYKLKFKVPSSYFPTKQGVGSGANKYGVTYITDIADPNHVSFDLGIVCECSTTSRKLSASAFNLFGIVALVLGMLYFARREH